jgi:PEP-CTERM motif
MKRVMITALAAAATVGLAAAATPASAGTLQLCTSGASCVSGTTNVNLGSYNAPGSLLVTGTVGIGGPEVDFASTNGLLETNTGAATIFTASGDPLTQLTFTLLSGTFTAAEFNLLSGTARTMSVTLTDSLGETQTIDLANANGSNIFNVIAGPGQSYVSASFSSTGGGFADFKQLRLVLGESVPAVPEPATWAMMLLGFGAIGLTMRRQRKRVLA